MEGAAVEKVKFDNFELICSKEHYCILCKTLYEHYRVCYQNQNVNFQQCKNSFNCLFYVYSFNFLWENFSLNGHF